MKQLHSEVKTLLKKDHSQNPITWTEYTRSSAKTKSIKCSDPVASIKKGSYVEYKAAIRPNDVQTTQRKGVHQ